MKRMHLISHQCTQIFDGIVYTAEMTLGTIVSVLGSKDQRDHKVILVEQVIDNVRALSSQDADFLINQCIIASALAQIDSANVAGEMPRVSQANFHVTVQSFRMSAYLDRERSGFLICMVAMETVAKFLEWYESS